MTPKFKKIIIVVTAIVIILFVYYMFINKEEDTSFLVTTSSSEMSEKNKILGQKITKTLIQIKDIKLEKAIFSNDVFLSLIDSRIKIDSQLVGRKNPFAPLSDTSVNYRSKSNPEEGDESGVNNENNSVKNLNVTTGSTSTATSTRSTTTSTSTRPGNSTTTVQ
jgi:hypothetical protein